MRICLVSDTLVGYHENWSGAEMVCKTLADLLKEEGEELLFLTTKFRVKKTSENICQLPAFTNRQGLLKKILLPFNMFQVAVLTTFCFWRSRPDVINFMRSNYLFVPVMIVAKIMRIPTVFTFLDYYMICDRGTFLMADGSVCQELEGEVCQRCIPGLKMMERKLLISLRKHLDGVITFTETSKKRLVKHGFAPEKVRVIYTHTIPERFREKAVDKIPDSCMVVAFFSPHKGLHVVLSAWPEVVSKVPGAKLTVVGKGSPEDTKRIDSLVSSLNIGNSVDFVGQKGNEEVLELILRHEVMTVPEQWPSEFGPLALVEAQAMGAAVVASRIGSTPDFVQDGFNGFLVERDNPSSFAEKIIFLFQNKEEARRMGEKARETGRFLFDRNQGRETIEFYKELIK